MWDGFTGVLPYAAFSAFLCFLVLSVPVWLGRGKARAIAAGRPVRIPCQLLGDEPPYAGEYERGELVVLSGGPLYFLSRGGPVLELPPGGTFERTLYARAEPGSGYGPWSGRRIVRTALVHRTPSGGSLRIETARGDSRALRAALQARPTGRPAPRRLPARLPVWCAVLGVVALLGAVPVTSIAVFGRQVAAHVTSNTGDDYCGVSWTDPWDGSRRAAEVDCIRGDDGHYGRGDTLAVIALPRPLRGNAFDTDSLPILGALCGAELLVSAFGTLLPHLRWRRHWRPSEAVPAPVAAPRPPAHPSPDPVLSLARPLDRLLGRPLNLPPDVHGSPWWRVSVLRKLVISDGVSFGGLTVLSVAAVLLYGLWTQDSGATSWVVLAVVAALAALARITYRAVDATRVVRTLLRAFRSGDVQEIRYALLYVAEAADTSCLYSGAAGFDGSDSRHAEVAVASASIGIAIPIEAVPEALAETVPKTASGPAAYGESGFSAGQEPGRLAHEGQL
ncbi:hypothetical protein QMK19_10690 [Streptomyces sp. H10-C2]|uniref:hypothetical protein n=1 Tax=Streptomyces sp. H10-C2 TaxID=3046210 RepID=UPI0024B8C07E|nr:hypothetical protein [Streptomyces sp. H10-C2]MDJ0370124.1 hypothetical protein [Streptomyces sp. H10-C2]